MTDVKFTATPRELRIIKRIADRAMKLTIARENDPYTALDIMMDITATHCNGNRLRLAALCVADDLNFAHDILGIRRHLDRDTGQLRDFFSPRFSEAL